MSYLVGGLAALGVLLLLARAYAGADPRSILRLLRFTVATVMIVTGGIMVFGGRWGLGLAIIAFGLSAMATGRLGPLDLGGGARSAGSGSTVRTALLDMQLDHDTGELDGMVLAGPARGRRLSELDDAAVMSLFRLAARDDQESAALLAAYLDRRLPGWRENFEGDATAGAGGAAQTGPMTDKQAYEILGLAPGANRSEIRAAHRRLMKRVHPDQGGSTFLAAKINQAKDRLLGDHR
ncbi:MAG: DnaJ domain-containing protein [Alphaproteobacteria bacterium]